jgi:hypothetical protein
LAPATDQGRAITLYLGILNVVIAGVWFVLYGFGVLTAKSILESSSLVAYVATFFVVAAGAVIVPVIESETDKQGIKAGIALSILSVAVYAGMVGMYVATGKVSLPGF